jgi:hypothetical protein
MRTEGGTWLQELPPPKKKAKGDAVYVLAGKKSRTIPPVYSLNLFLEIGGG